MTDARNPRAAVSLPPVLAALDAAVRGISEVLDVERVLQGIVDRVRELADAQYAALGITDDAGLIERFITSGIERQAREAIGELPRGRGLLGLIIRENRSYRIADIGSHPESYGFPPHHPPMTSLLGVPITVAGGTVGRLYLTNKHGASEFSEADQALVETFALHAGIAIQNARLHEQVQRLAVVDERERISKDLHDSIIQAIYAVTLALDDVPELIGTAPDEARRRVDDGIDALHAVIRDIRNFIFGLRPVLLDAGGLIDGLRTLADELRRNSTVEVEIRGEEPPGLPIDTVVELLSVAREALSNVARHSGAARAWVELKPIRGSRLRMTVGDDGRGFGSDEASTLGHHGLANMRGRAVALGGAFAVESEPGAGARIIVTLPRIASRLNED